MLFDDKEFYREYIKKLQKYSQKAYLDSVFTDLDSELNEKLNHLYKEWPYHNFRKSILYHNQSYIREVLNPFKAMYSNFLEKDNHQLKLNFGNIQMLPVEVLSIIINDSLTIYPEHKIVLPGKTVAEFADYQDYTFVLPKNNGLSDEAFNNIKVVHRILGIEELRSIQVFPWDHYNKEILEKDLYQTTIEF